MNAFLQRHAATIRGVLQGFDRVRLRGTLQRFAYAAGMASFLTCRKILLKDFAAFAEQTTQAVRRAADERAERAGRPAIYLERSSEDKERLVQQILRRDGVGNDGLVAVLKCVEPCSSFDIYRDRQHEVLSLRRRWRKCLHYYFYLRDSMFGLVNVRLQTWFPFDVRIVFNGREWLSRQLDAAKIGYRRSDNCFTWVENFARAQRCFDRQLRIAWVKHADRLLRRASPDMASLLQNWHQQHYWSMEQSEWATDVVFKTTKDLAALYPRLIRHAMESFASPDVMRFLGRKLTAEGKVPGHFTGEVVSDVIHRPEGVRIKHRVNRNSIKMYDKQGVVLRVETTINNAGDLKSYRPKAGDPLGPKHWLPLRQSVADARRRAELCQAANNRYLEALAAVERTQPLSSLADRVCQPLKDEQGRARARALNPLSPDDAKLLQAVSGGEFAITGFRNRDVRQAFFGADPSDPTVRRRQSGQVSRKLALLRAHGLIKKIPHTHRYVLTKQGLLAIPAFLAARKANLAKLTAAA